MHFGVVVSVWALTGRDLGQEGGPVTGRLNLTWGLQRMASLLAVSAQRVGVVVGA